MSLEWQEVLVTGIESIDNQHREIFERFATFSAACSEGTASEELLNLLAFLATYTVNHFLEEEESMAAVDYPELLAQKEAHDTFIADLGRLKQFVDEGGPCLELVLTEKRTMIRWLINHISHLDRAYADYMSGDRTHTD